VIRQIMCCLLVGFFSSVSFGESVFFDGFNREDTPAATAAECSIGSGWMNPKSPHGKVCINDGKIFVMQPTGSGLILLNDATVPESGAVYSAVIKLGRAPNNNAGLVIRWQQDGGHYRFRFAQNGQVVVAAWNGKTDKYEALLLDKPNAFNPIKGRAYEMIVTEQGPYEFELVIRDTVEDVCVYQNDAVLDWEGRYASGAFGFFSAGAGSVFDSYRLQKKSIAGRGKMTVSETALMMKKAERVAGQIADFFVAPDGSDQFSGKLSEINFEKNDGPFKTLRRARDAVREIAPSLARDIVVMLRGGTYSLEEPFVLGVNDSGKNGANIVYQNYPGETPVITSSSTVEGWRKVSDSEVRIPDVAKENVWVTALPEKVGMVYSVYSGTNRLPRAREEAGFITPRQFLNFREFLDTWQEVPPAALYSMTFPKNTITDISRIREIEVIVRPSIHWTMNILGLKSFDPTSCEAQFLTPACYPVGKVFGEYEHPNAWLENTFAGLDNDGEWVFDRESCQLYLLLGNGRRPENISIPNLTELVRIEGDIHYELSLDVPVRNVIFSGLTFTQAKRYTWEENHLGWGLQHHWEMFDRPTAMLRFRGAQNCVVKNCEFVNSAAAGVRFDLFAEGNTVKDSVFSDLGGVGILLAGYGPGTKDVNKNNSIENNHIFRIGTDYWHSPAIFIWQSGGNRIVHNLIHNTPYSGIVVSGRIQWDKNGFGESSKTVRWDELASFMGAKSVPGWEERESFLHSRGNMVESNELHHVMELLGDGNAVYVSGCGAGNTIRRNYIHDIEELGAISALRTDDKQNDTYFYENIIMNCVCPAIVHKHRNHMVNNIMINCGSTVSGSALRAFIAMRAGPVNGSIFKRNVFYSKHSDVPAYQYGKTYAEPSRPWDCYMDWNVYFCSSDSEWEERTLRWHQSRGIEENSQIVNLNGLVVNGEFNPDFDIQKYIPDFLPLSLNGMGIVRKCGVILNNNCK
jgi:hypothetical protein